MTLPHLIRENNHIWVIDMRRCEQRLADRLTYAAADEQLQARLRAARPGWPDRLRTAVAALRGHAVLGQDGRLTPVASPVPVPVHER